MLKCLKGEDHQINPYGSSVALLSHGHKYGYYLLMRPEKRRKTCGCLLGIHAG
jgi:hypothetical protein